MLSLCSEVEDPTDTSLPTTSDLKGQSLHKLTRRSYHSLDLVPLDRRALMNGAGWAGSFHVGSNYLMQMQVCKSISRWRPWLGGRIRDTISAIMNLECRLNPIHRLVGSRRNTDVANTGHRFSSIYHTGKPSNRWTSVKADLASIIRHSYSVC